MRTNLVDGLIFGVTISLIVLVARSLFGDAPLALLILILCGIALGAIQLVVARRRAAAPPDSQPEPAGDEPAAPPPRSPHLDWSGLASPAQSEPAAAEDGAAPEPPEAPAAPQEAADGHPEKQEKMV